MSSRTARATQRNPVSKNKNKQTKEKEKERRKESQAVVVYTFNPSIQEVEAEAGKSLKFEAILIYRASSRTARATQRTLSQNQPTKQTNK